MSKISVETAPVFSIRQIDPKAILEAIYKGQYIQRPTISVTTKKLDPLVKKVVSTSSQNTTCSYIFSDGSEGYETVTTGIDAFTGNIATGICIYCRRQRELPFGICAGIEVSTQRTTYFIMDRRICTPQCALARVNEMSLLEKEKDKCIKETQEMLQAMTGEAKPFDAARDFLLLEDHDGPMSGEEWSNSKSTYRLVPDCFVVPVKREYVVKRAHI